jgi:dolichol kinase
MKDDYGWKFWLKVAGLFVAGAIGLFIVAWIFLSVVYAWSVLGALLLLAVVALIFGWIHDRRNQSHGEGSY